VPHVNPHDVPLHVAEPLDGTGQAVHDVVPQLAVLVLATHALPHRWKPLLHVNPHDVPLHVAVLLAGTGQAVHDEPQVAVLVLLAHALPQV
jgi:hypothetical protein